MSNYKTNDLKIVSKARTMEKVKLQIPNIDTSVKSLLGQNAYQSPQRIFAGEITDMNYTSTQEQHALLRETKARAKELNQKIPPDIREELQY